MAKLPTIQRSSFFCSTSRQRIVRNVRESISYDGILNCSKVDPKELSSERLRDRVASLILVHNHLSRVFIDTSYAFLLKLTLGAEEAWCLSRVRGTFG